LIKEVDLLNFIVKTFDLSKKRENKNFALEGNYFNSFAVLELTGTCKIKLSRNGDWLELGTQVSKMAGVDGFNEIWLTNNAQADKEVKIIFGQNLSNTDFDVFKQLSQVGVDINSTVGLKAGDLNLDPSKNVGSVIEVDQVGLFKTTDFTEDRNIVTVPKVGTEGNVWNNELTGINTNGGVVNIENVKHLSIFGDVDGATDIYIMVSQDNINFYKAAAADISPAGSGNFHIETDIGANYVTLQSSNDVTATATIAGKG
jgi:hypothetical protein